MFGASIGRGAQRIIDAIVRWLAKGHISPNILTVIGVSLNVGCGLLLGRAISSGPESPSSSPTFSTCWTGKWPVCRVGSRDLAVFSTPRWTGSRIWLCLWALWSFMPRHRGPLNS